MKKQRKPNKMLGFSTGDVKEFCMKIQGIRQLLSNDAQIYSDLPLLLSCICVIMFTKVTERGFALIMKAFEVNFCAKLAKGIAQQFGPNCEVVVHDLYPKDPDHSIVAIENGHVSGRRLGDGPSHVVWETMKSDPRQIQDRLAYLTRTEDGKILKSSTIFIRDEVDKIVGIFAINYDITLMKAMEEQLRMFTATDDTANEPQTIIHNVNDLLEELIKQSVKLVGKPVALMNKEDKVKAIRFLNDSGAFLITKSGQRVCNFFGISKYTLYTYIDEAKGEKDK